MGFCWSGECGNGPCWAGHYMPGWVGPTVQLCIYGFCSMMRPIEPFMTEFLTGTYKNLTTEQVTRQVFPVWAYSNLFLLVPVLLVTDFLRYKPVIILQGLSYVTMLLLLLLGSGVRSAQLAFFIYSIAMATDVGYFSYIYSLVQPSYYQRVTSYVKGAILIGYAVGALLAQLLVFLGVSLYCLAAVTLASVSIALITSFFLPMPKTSLYFKGTYSEQQPSSSEDAHNLENQDFFMWVKIKTVAMRVERMFRGFLSDCKKCYSSVAVFFFCIWAAAGKCGFYQVAGYVQVLWADQEPQNFTAYNGVVDGFSTLAGAAGTFVVGHVSMEWSVWGELVLGGFTFVISGVIFLMDLTDNIWISYMCFFLFKTIYMQLATICTFQIATKLKRERYGLVFGVNSFVGTALQSVLTAIIINTKSIQLTITSQFLVYALYFAAISVLFIVRGVYTVLYTKRPAEHNQTERASSLPEVTHL